MDIKELVQKYNLTRNDAWQLPQNNRLWILTHDACEKIAAIENIEVKELKIINSEREMVRLQMTMSKGDKNIITTGEADSQTSKCKYYLNMAEKRCFDRGVLKLINSYEYGIYSEVEADEFERKNKEGV